MEFGVVVGVRIEWVYNWLIIRPKLLVPSYAAPGDNESCRLFLAFEFGR